METVLVDGKKIASKILQDLKLRGEALKEKGFHLKGHIPTLAVVLVGNDPASHTYVQKKGEAAETLGIKFLRFDFDASIEKDALIAEIQKIQETHSLSGMIIQLPLPSHLRPATRDIVNYISFEIDVDCLSYESLGKLLMRQNTLLPPGPAAIMEIFRYHEVALPGKELCIIGRGHLIGRPLTALLLAEDIALTVCGTTTPNIQRATKRADIIITGVGKKDILTGGMIKKGCVVVDAGICFVDGKMYGDVQFASVNGKASLLTPVPGGVGPITVAKLLENTIAVEEKRTSL